MVLSGSRTCYLAVHTSRGPHVTPHAFVVSGGRIWFTTSRDARKVRALREDPRASVLVTGENGSVLIGGTVSVLDVIDPRSIAGSAAEALRSPRALLRLSLRTFEEAAGYALSALELPLAWLPPNRVLLSLRPHSTVALDGRGGLLGRYGTWARHAEPPALVDRVLSLRADRPARGGPSGIHAGALAWGTVDGSVTVPAVLNGDTGIARIPRSVVRYLRTAEAPAAFVAHAASGIRPTQKHGMLVRGRGSIVKLGRTEARVYVDPASLTRWCGFGSSTTMLEREAG